MLRQKQKERKKKWDEKRCFIFLDNFKPSEHAHTIFNNAKKEFLTFCQKLTLCFFRNGSSAILAYDRIEL